MGYNLFTKSHFSHLISFSCLIFIRCDQKTYKKKILNKIVILKRGECPFMTKTQVAQELGGLGVIIISNNDIIQPPMKGEEEDDSHISIPTIMFILIF